MDLIKHPVTEMEYWETIEGLGGMSWSVRHSLYHNRIDERHALGAIGEVGEIIKLQTQLVAELKQKFGIIPPRETPVKKLGEKLPPAPEGMRYYWDWYEVMKLKFYAAEYEKIICSACTLSGGLEQFGTSIPCKPFTGIIYNLEAPYKCTMLRDWDEKRLHKEIVEAGGHIAYLRFKIKEIRLKLALTRKARSKSE